MGQDPQYAKYPKLSLAQDIFTLTNPSSPDPLRHTALKKLQDAISEFKMAPLYRHLAHPTEGLLNVTGEGSAQKPPTKARKPSTTSKLVASNKLVSSTQFPWDEELYERLTSENNKELEAFKTEEEEAAEKAGDTEVQAAKGKRAEFWARVGDKVRSILLLSALVDADHFWNIRKGLLRPMKQFLRKQVY